MNHPPRSMPAQRRTTLVAFLVLLMAVLTLTVFMVLPYVLAVTMGGILALLARPVFQWLQGHHLPPRVAAAPWSCSGWSWCSLCRSLSW